MDSQLINLDQQNKSIKQPDERKIFKINSNQIYLFGDFVHLNSVKTRLFCCVFFLLQNTRVLEKIVYELLYELKIINQFSRPKYHLLNSS